MADFETKLRLLPWILGGLIITSCVHEAGHAWAAWRLGDRREYIEQRKVPWTFRHISWIFTIIVPAIMLMLAGFMMGGAKPVRVRVAIGPARMALVALAGPVGNFFVGALSIGIAAGLVHAGVLAPGLMPPLADDLYVGLMYAVMLSFLLGIVNLIPIPPLDGSRIIAVFLPEKVRRIYYGMTVPFLIILAVLFLVLMTTNSALIGRWTAALIGWCHEWTLVLRDWIRG